MHKCYNSNCNNKTNNPKFCSRSCSVTFYNKKRPKRKRKKYTCRICGIEVPGRRVLCDKHNPQIIAWSKLTLKDIIYSYNQKYGASNRYTRIRDHAKNTYINSNRPKYCEKCGYEYHYHVCHIKPIHMFNLDTPISIINDLNNLMALCPNCHWELDNGLFAPSRN